MKIVKSVQSVDMLHPLVERRVMDVLQGKHTPPIGNRALPVPRVNFNQNMVALVDVKTVLQVKLVLLVRMNVVIVVLRELSEMAHLVMHALKVNITIKKGRLSAKIVQTESTTIKKGKQLTQLVKIVQHKVTLLHTIKVNAEIRNNLQYTK